jgi:hypothetical protein
VIRKKKDGQQFQKEDDVILVIQLRKFACCRYEYLLAVQYISITWDIKAVPYITVRYWDGAPWRHVPGRLVLYFQNSLSSAGVWFLFLFVDSAMFCGQCTVLWTVHCAVDSLLKLFEVSSFLKLATACLMLWLRRRGAMPLLYSYAIMTCTGTVLTRLKLALLLTKCPASIMRSRTWP